MLWGERRHRRVEVASMCMRMPGLKWGVEPSAFCLLGDPNMRYAKMGTYQGLMLRAGHYRVTPYAYFFFAEMACEAFSDLPSSYRSVLLVAYCWSKG